MAGKAVGSIRISLTAATAKFTKGMVKAGGTVKRFSLNAAKALAKFSIAAAASFAAVGLAIAALAKNSASLLDQLGKTADRLGFTTENLAAMQLAARRAGIENSKLELSMQRMARRVAEASKGMGEAQAALEELGLDAKELVKLSPDAMFLKVAKALEGVNNQNDKLRLGFKLFDSEGVDLIRLTGSAIEQATIDAEKYGLAVSRVDIAKIEAAHDAWGDIRDAIRGFGNVIAIQAAVPMQKLAQSILDTDTQSTQLAFDIASAIDFLKPLIATIIAGVQSIPRAFTKTIIVLGKMQIGLKGVALAYDKATTAAFNFATKIVGGFDAGGQSRFSKAQSEIDKLISENIELEKSYESTGTAIDIFSAAYDRTLKALNSGSSIYSKQFAETQKFADQWDKTAEQFQESFKNDIAGTLESGVSGFIGDLKSGENAFQAFGNAIARIAEDIAESLLIATLKGKGGDDGGLLGSIASIIGTTIAGGGGGGSYADGTSGPQGSGSIGRGLGFTPALAGAGGGGNTIININGAKGNKEIFDLVESAIDSKSPEIEKRTVAKVSKLNANNSAFMGRA